MNRIIILCIGFIALNSHLSGIKAPLEDWFAFPTENADSLPTVLAKNHSDLIAGKLRFDTVIKFGVNQLTGNMKDWETYRVNPKNEIIEKTGVVINHNLALSIKETGTIQMKGYSIKKITFQTRPRIYATANQYISDGKGPFPDVINTVGHWSKSKIDSTGQHAVGHSLALNGYGCLTIDPGDPVKGLQLMAYLK